jgi:signal transduction histidine kinase
MSEQEEQQTEKKKAGIVKRIFKWLGLGLITLLLIASIIFQAPWKVITLFAIIFLVCTILPKAYRKWFWLSVGAVVIALIIWVFLPDDNQGWRPYTFDEEIAALEAKYAVPDEENAAIIYDQLLESYNEAAFEPNFLDPNLEGLIRREPWSSRDYTELSQWIKQHESTITKLIEASKIEKCQFPIVADSIALSGHMKILIPMRRWAFLLVYAANNDLGDDRIDQALEKCIILLRMGNHMCQQPSFVDLMVGVAVEALAIGQFNRFVIYGDATEERLGFVEQALADIKHDWSHDFPRIFECERQMAKSELCTLMYEINSKNKVRFSRNPWAGMKEQMENYLQDDEMKDPNIKNIWESRLHPTYLQRKLFKATVIAYWFYMPSNPQIVAKIIDKEYEKLAFANPNFDIPKSSKEFYIPSLLKCGFNYCGMIKRMTEILRPLYYSVHDIYLRTITEQRGSLLIIALRRYKNRIGDWPESLDEIKSFVPSETLVDPINGDSFVYKLTEENFALYSKGKNNIDENGQYNSTWDPNTFKSTVEEDDMLIWPTKKCKSQKGKNNDEQQ